MRKLKLLFVLLCVVAVSHAQTYDKTDGALTSQEKEELVEWAASVGTPQGDDNWGNYWLLRYFYLDDVYYIYNMSGDIRIVNNLMSVAEKAVRSNNKRHMQEQIHTGWDTINDLPMGEVLPSWPHSDDYGKDKSKKLVNTGDAGETLIGSIFMSIAARTIIESPQIWNVQVPNEEYTYLERARFYVDESVEATELTFKRLYVDPVTKAQQYQADYPSYEWLKMRKAWQQKGVYSPFNRIWHAQVLFTYLNPCLEQLKIHPEKVEEYDEISRVAVDLWVDSAVVKYEEHGVEMFDYPYRYAPNDVTNSEDVGHCAYDVYEIGMMYRSGRYPRVDNEMMTRFANTIVNKVHKGDGVYSYRLSGEGEGGKPRNFFLQLKRFNPEIVNHTLKGEHQLLVARAFQELEVQYRTNKGKWIQTHSIAVREGDDLEIKATYPSDKRNWSWSGPNEFSKRKQQIEFKNIGRESAGTYEVSYKDKNNLVRTNYIKVIVY